MGQAESVICSEKQKKTNHKNSTHSKIKFYIILIYFFFPMMDIKIFLKGGLNFFFTYYYIISSM